MKDRPNIEEIMGLVRARVAERREAGAYEDAVVAQAERSRWTAMVREEDALDVLLAQLHLVSWVDFRDPGLLAPRSMRERVEGWIKRMIWGCLKFYHLRLFGQQNGVNKLMLLGMDDYHGWFEGRANALEQRLAGLEAARGGGVAVAGDVKDGEGAEV